MQDWQRSGWRWMVFGILSSAIGLILVFRGIDWPHLVNILAGMELEWLILAIVVYFVSVWVGAARWRWLFWPHFNPRIGSLFGLLGVAQLVNTVIPGRLGLPTRALMAGTEEGASRLMVLTTLLVEKVLEASSLVLLGLVLIILWPEQIVEQIPRWIQTAGMILAMFVVGFWIILWLVSGFSWRSSLISWLEKGIGVRVAGWVGSSLDGLDALRSSKAGWRLWLLSLLYWILIGSVNGIVIRAGGLNLPILAPLFMLIVLQIGVRLPSTPANLGVFDYLGVLSLTPFGVDKTTALGIIVILHLVYTVPLALVGAYFLLARGLGLNRLYRQVKS